MGGDKEREGSRGWEEIKREKGVGDARRLRKRVEEGERKREHRRKRKGREKEKDG